MQAIKDTLIFLGCCGIVILGICAPFLIVDALHYFGN
ncbi:hypothetical protein PMW_51 [Pseudomonas phage phiPMW]|uniref:Uncharacterized protein n=1 Tax=Pseudomonas phage phiPMW TaxID=1815582 RepID=A0A1S5R191_9CAUD|nr:hypothetical protein FDG97_gp051 [Pseudomonas phage phiPMW]ANA49176.1 hypothetical protein PMW_51 [Pseudomonas phage phiPMW]